MSKQSVASEHIALLEARMRRLAKRNPEQGIKETDYKTLYPYLAVQQLTFLHDDDLFERLTFVDRHETGMSEELLDAFLITENDRELEVRLFQFKFNGKYKGGVSTKEFFAFVDRMNREFLKADLLTPSPLEAYSIVRKAISEARKTNPKARRTKIRCYYIVNGQEVSDSDRTKMEAMRETFSSDRQAHGFQFEAHGGIAIYKLITEGRIPIIEERLQLETSNSPSPYLYHDIGRNPNGMPLKAIVGFVNVNQLTRLVDRYSNHELFEYNVRLFLGTGRRVNQGIIETVTSDRSSWFAFMNNGISITAEAVHINAPGSGGKLDLELEGMQIINGCQTANALYHAKYDENLRDRFQGNSKVLVRIYEVAPGNEDFLQALIVATNSQNGIRPQDLYSNDQYQRSYELVLSKYGIGYERKPGQLVGDFPEWFPKEDAAKAFVGVILGESASLRNTLSTAKVFSKTEEYQRIFVPENISEITYEQAEDTPEFRYRCLEFWLANQLVREVKNQIAGLPVSERKSRLRKGTYFIANMMYSRHEKDLAEEVERQSEREASPLCLNDLRELIQKAADKDFNHAAKAFDEVQTTFIKETDATEDASLKNKDFGKRLKNRWNS